ncbi:hypothetical protein BDK51DRAFT_49937 [Blyttiomyces helicus]|uniref:Uncharacterized protein n=1 Tax=Blyttiomyces helicus TaxID=388810 RepID=A0A4P9WEP3_9FUNG|nr:hypothetical protein BDK51DRAFT_49937 [Blyttiomyces helicus]|eukprot:RKO91074.1 hypothetical protein BDK51DRAFT_49937 [Blyttiomyces helicus]
MTNGATTTTGTTNTPLILTPTVAIVNIPPPAMTTTATTTTTTSNRNLAAELGDIQSLSAWFLLQRARAALGEAVRRAAAMGPPQQQQPQQQPARPVSPPRRGWLSADREWEDDDEDGDGEGEDEGEIGAWEDVSGWWGDDENRDVDVEVEVEEEEDGDGDGDGGGGGGDVWARRWSGRGGEAEDLLDFLRRHALIGGRGDDEDPDDDDDTDVPELVSVRRFRAVSSIGVRHHAQADDGGAVDANGDEAADGVGVQMDAEGVDDALDCDGSGAGTVAWPRAATSPAGAVRPIGCRWEAFSKELTGGGRRVGAVIRPAWVDAGGCCVGRCPGRRFGNDANTIMRREGVLSKSSSKPTIVQRWKRMPVDLAFARKPLGGSGDEDEWRGGHAGIVTALTAPPRALLRPSSLPPSDNSPPDSSASLPAASRILSTASVPATQMCTLHPSRAVLL